MRSLLDLGRKYTLRERFEAKYVPVTESGCWLWVGAVRKYKGGRFEYGVINDKFTLLSAHRLSYELHKGKIPKGMSVLHTCDVSCCVNPDHLFVGTRADNIADMDRKKRRVILRGEQSTNAKVTSDQVRAIRTSPTISRILAVQYNCSSSLIRRIKRRVTWKHIA